MPAALWGVWWGVMLAAATDTLAAEAVGIPPEPATGWNDRAGRLVSRNVEGVMGPPL